MRFCFWKIYDYTEDPYSWWVLEPYLEGKELNEENVSNAISEYYNALEKKAQECIKQINSNFLINVFSNMVDCGSEFWEIEGAYIKEKMPKCSEDDNVQIHGIVRYCVVLMMNWMKILYSQIGIISKKFYNE